MQLGVCTRVDPIQDRRTAQVKFPIVSEIKQPFMHGMS
jgi:hypothetical protein